MKRLILFTVCCMMSLLSGAQTRTLQLSDIFTTHVVFSTEVTYVDLSNSSLVGARVVQQNKNVLALKAMKPFDSKCSVTVLQSNGMIHTFIVEYCSEPEVLVVDMKKAPNAQRSDDVVVANESTDVILGDSDNTVVATMATSSGDIPPTMTEVLGKKRDIFHIVSKQYGVTLACCNIFVCNDVTYLVFELDNQSGISYATGDPEFTIESKKKSKRQVEYANKIMPRSRFGSLSAESGGKESVVYCFDKVTLGTNQEFKVYVYEDNGQRNLSLTLSASDLNKAVKL